MAKLSKEKTKQVIELLLKAYPDAQCALDYDSAYHLLISVVLSAQTTDVSVNKVTPALFKAAPDARAMAELSEETIQDYIRSIGLYRAKAHNIKELSKALIENFGGEVPKTQEELMSLPGVGQKTANVVRAEAFGQQAIAVDTHVFRVSNRIGLAEADNVKDTELQLQKAIPYDKWTMMHHALIWHGRNCCHARKPDCENCPVSGLCRFNNKKTK